MAGLTCAAKCTESGLDYLLIEKSNRVGGRVGSIAKEGYILDVGFQVYNTAYRRANEVASISSADLNRFKPGAAIVTRSRISVLSDPFRDPGAFFKTLFCPYATSSDMVKILRLKHQLMDYDFLQDISEEISTLKFLHNYGFSSQIIHHFFKPFFAGVFLEEDLNTSDRFFKFVFSSLNKGFATLPQAGMQMIPDRIAAKIPSQNLLLNTSVEQIESGNTLHLGNGEEVKFQKLVLTGESSRLVCEEPIVYNPVYTLFVSTKLPIPEPKYIHLYPDDDLLNNMAVVSEVSPSYTTHDDHLLSISILGNRGKRKGVDAEVIQRLCNYYGGEESDYQVKDSIYLEKATLLQKPGSMRPKLSKNPNIHFAGDIQTHGSIEGAVVSGLSVFEELV